MGKKVGSKFDAALTPEHISKQTPEWLKNWSEFLEGEAADIREARSRLTEGMKLRYLAAVDGFLGGEGVGTAKVNDGKIPVKIGITKKVTWNSNGLQGLHNELGEDYDHYVTTVAKVAEAKYTGAPKAVQRLLDPHRTVNRGSWTFTYAAPE